MAEKEKEVFVEVTAQIVAQHPQESQKEWKRAKY